MRLLAAVAAALLSCGSSSSSSVVDLAAADGPPPPPPPPPPWHEKQHRHDGGGWPYTPPSFPDSCLGEYSFCNSTGSCVLDSANATMCGACKKGEYLCPGPALVCAGSAAEYRTACPGLQGTHLDETLPIEQRLDYLIAHTTLADWVPQMYDNAPAIPRLGIPAYVWLNDDVHGVNGPHATVFPDGCGLGASFDKDMMHAVGLALGSEARAVHNGFVHDGDRGADGSTYSPDHGENGVGITMYGPNINLVRDPRWGRSQETYGECPTLTGKLSIPFVRGSQGSDIDGVSLNANGTWLAGSCCKHYAAYDVESYPIDRGHFSANVTADDMFEYYLAPFHDCIATAEAMHVMTSLNAVNGVATSADPDLVDGILRNFSDSWNFSGFVVTDYGGWEGIGGGPGAFGDHGCDNPNARKDTCCKDVECSALKGVQAGLDSDGGGMLALQQIPKLVSAGQLSEERIAMSFRRLMRQRVRLGMFDPPTSNAYNRLAFGTVESAKHSELARTAAQKAICLYQNRVAKATTTMQQDELEVEVEGVDGAEGEGEDRGQNEEGTRAFWLASQNSNGTLPLNLAALSAKPHSVLLAGWTADDGDNLFGNYVQHTDRGGINASILAGLAQALGTPMPTPAPPACDNTPKPCPGHAGRTFCKNVVAAGQCDKASKPCPPCPAPAGGGNSSTSPLVFEPGCSDSSCPGTDVIRRVKAHEAAKEAEVTVLVLGLTHNSKNNDDGNGQGGNVDSTHENEGHDRKTIAFPPGQLSLAASLSAQHTGTPLVCVLVHGGSLAPATLMRDCDAIVDLWYPGDMGAHALADVLFGRVSPAGRTTQTWYESDETIPAPGVMKMRPDAAGSSVTAASLQVDGDGGPGGSSGWTYRYHNKRPAIPFGHGLSYTEFKYSALTLNTTDLVISGSSGDGVDSDPCSAIGVQVTVTNIGSVDSDEVVQCYIKQPNASTAPQVRLADFARVHIKAGQSTTVSLSFGPKEQALVLDGASSGSGSSVYQPHMVVPAGAVEVHVGGGQPDFFEGAVMKTVTIQRTANLTRSYTCA